MTEPAVNRESRETDIAIVGMAARFPGARDTLQFWRNLRAGVECISFFSDEELLAAGVDPQLLAHPDYVKAAAVLEDIELFDAAFFGFSRREAEITDPQHRLFLECAWQALEDAAYDPAAFEGTVGVLAGVSMSSYLLNLYAESEAMRSVGQFRTLIGNDKDHLPTWTSYKLNLQGPSVNVQTACSTSLVAVHLACQSLLGGECDMALAGGASVGARQKTGYLYEEGGIRSPDGHCRAFDAMARGTVGGNGVGVVVLRRLSDALVDGDTVRAVIRGSAINNDGSVKVGYTAPGLEGQVKVISEALAVAEVEPATIDYVEAHGTGTALGDPIEIEALQRAFRRDDVGGVAIGSVKTNIGHLDAAAGVAGLIKTTLALEHRYLPPSLHFERPNAKTDFERSPFRVNSELVAWPSNGRPRRAGVSSFGIGGTNAHLVLEEAPLPPDPAPSRRLQLVLLSARSEPALTVAGRNLAAHLAEHPDSSLADVAYTLQVGRRAFRHRRMSVCSDVEDAATVLAETDSRRLVSASDEPRRRSVVFLLPGQGAHYEGLARQLYAEELSFREQVDRCCELLGPHLRSDLQLLLGLTGEGADVLSWTDTAVAQPALFVIEYALARLWMEWGVVPEALLGHSLGEYVAACLAGVWSLADALALVAARGRLMAELPPGVMTAVSTDEASLTALLPPDVSLAAINAPARCVVSGPEPALVDLERQLVERGIASRRLTTSRAFHSKMTEAIADRFAERLAETEMSPPAVPFLSNLTGTWITPEQATDPGYWTDQMCRPVRFAEAVEEVLQEEDRVFLEVGPGRTLATLARQSAGRHQGSPPVASLPAGGDEVHHLLTALGRLWLAGVTIDWHGFWSRERRRRVPLPSYPFERQPYWIEVPRAPAASRPQARPSVAEPTFEVGEPPVAGTPVDDPPTSRRERILALLGEVVSDLTGIPAVEIDAQTSFLDAGVDSLLLVQASQAIERRFRVKVTFTQLMEETTTLATLADYIERELPPEALPPPAACEREPEPAATPSLAAPPPESAVERIVAQQLAAMQELMTRQLEMLERGRASAPRAAGAEATAPAPRSTAVAPPDPAGVAPAAAPSARQFGPFPAMDLSRTDELDERQQRHLDGLIARYTERTAESKRLTQEGRAVLAENRASAGFRLLWKEMVYPIVARRTAGSRLWDVDGNEYIDLTMGFGVSLFGHLPEFVTEALRRQLDDGIQVGPQTFLAAEVAQLVHRLTGVERVIFCNSGTEAVMTALRVARTVGHGNKVVIFTGSYHGTFDGTLARRPWGRNDGALPVAAGIPQGMVEDLYILDFAAPEALQFIETHADELAAVLLEPVQSRRPELQPKDFLHDLRRLTERLGVALIFDEMITGFRIHPGGAQAWFGVEADLVTYGKVAGGGLPIGVLGGKAAYMDAIDGGYWRFGDDSYPRVDKTFFAGTFCKHPLAMAAARAALSHLEAAGPALQEELNRRTAELAATLNRWFQEHDVPIRALHFGSVFRLEIDPEVRHGELFFYHLVEQGVYVWEGRTCFLSTAHSEEDVARVVTAIQRSVEALWEGGLLPGGRPAPRNLPLTDLQEQMWILAQMSTEASVAYNESLALDLRGALDAGALERALTRLAERHEALRTTFDPEGEHQVVSPTGQLPLAVTDLTGLDTAAQTAALRHTSSKEARLPFDLGRGPLARARLIGLAERRHRLVLTLHHIITDGWSFGLLLADLRALYALEVGRQSAALRPPVAFSTFLASREEAARQRDPKASQAFWRAILEGGIPALDLPLDRPRPPVQTYSGALISAGIGRDRLRRARGSSARRGGTLFMSLAAAYCLLLHRLTGQARLAVGIHSAGQLTQTDAVGCCLKLLPLFSRIAPATPAEDYLSDIQRRVSRMVEHRDVSIRQLLRQLGHKPDPSRPPMVAAAFNLDQGAGSQGFAGLEAGLEINHNGGAKFEIYLNSVEVEDGLRFDIEYNTDLFEAVTVRRWAGYYRTLLVSILEDGGRPLTDLPWLDRAERHQLLIEWQDTAAAEATSATLHQLVQSRAVDRPDAVAVVFESEQLTYFGLSREADRLAHRLRHAGAGPETLVWLFLERSVEMVVALLATLEAGAAYVPLDPAHPSERLAATLADAETPLVVTVERLAGALPRELSAGGPRRGQVLCLDGERALAAAGSDDDPAVRSVPESLAYAIYTSGSTGRPKGAMNAHRGIVNRLFWMQQALALEPGDSVLQKTPYSFDVSVWEFFWPLSVGARLVVARPGGHQDPRYLAVTISDQRVTTVHFVPSMLDAFLSDLPPASCRDLRRVVVSGEALSRQLATRCHRHLAHAALYNLYGPTEAAVDVSFWPCRHPAPDAPIPIGRPIANLALYVTDRASTPAPIGVVGELLIGGDGVGRGYLRRPALTAERFVPDPWRRRCGARLYRTGDLVRHRPDGAIDFLGRLDHQVKVRGHRIELAEIELTLERHPRVLQAAVVVHTAAAGDRRLVACWVPVGAAPTVTELRDFLSRKLPEPMLPALFVALEALPQLPNGKLDRAALGRHAARSAARRPNLEPRYRAPQTPVERTLAGLWSETLGVDRLGVDDNFFELGGDSILAVRIAARARQKGLELIPMQLFRSPTVARLAASLLGTRPEAGRHTGPLALTHYQRRLLESPGALDSGHRAVLLELPQNVDWPALTRAVGLLLVRQDGLRLHLERLPDGWRQTQTEPASVPACRVDLRLLADAALPQSSAEARAVLGLPSGDPPTVFYLLDFGTDRGGRLLIVLHPVVADTPSWTIVLRQLAVAYRGAGVDRPSVSFRRWAEAVAGRADAAEQRRDFWLSPERQTVRSLPSEDPNRGAASAVAPRLSAELAGEPARQLLEDTLPALRVELEEALLWSLVRVIQPWAGAASLLVDVEISTRRGVFTDLDLTATVGNLSAVYPLLVDLTAASDAMASLRAFKEQLRSVPGRGLDYGLLSTSSHSGRQLVALQRAQIRFSCRRQLDAVDPKPFRCMEVADGLGELRTVTEPESAEPYRLEIEGWVGDRLLRVDWSYNPRHHRRATVEELMHGMMQELRGLSEDEQPSRGSYTPSDFPRARLDQKSLDKILNQIQGTSEVKGR